MNENTLHTGQHVLVVGSGKSGMAACRLLKCKGAEVCLTDSRARELQDENDLKWLDDNVIIQEFGKHHSATFLMADLIVVSPGVPLTIKPLQEAERAGVEIIGELELGYQYFTGEIVAITGTNGKTTVTSMIGECLRNAGRTVFVGGNIGTPLCSHVMDENQAEVAVLEVSSFQLDSSDTFRCKVGLLLNMSPDHLDRYRDYDAYCDSKMRLFAGQTEEDVAIINGHDVEVQKRKGAISARMVEFAGENWVVDEVQELLTWRTMESGHESYHLKGYQLSQPNIQNCMAAISGARFMGATQDAVQHMLTTFDIPLHRLTVVGVWQDVEFINDSKATNIGAVVSALAGMDKPVVLIAGGRDKGGDYALLDVEVKRIVKRMILIGEAAEKMQDAFAGLTDVTLASSMADAVEKALAHAEKGETVLLSPACASFDMFKSYSERGDTFMQSVRNLAGRGQKGSTSEIIQQAV